MKMSTDREFDQKILAVEADRLSLFLSSAVDTLVYWEEYDTKRSPIFSKIEKFGTHKVAENIIAELIGDEVVDKSYQLTSGTFLLLTVDDLTNRLLGKIETTTNESNAVFCLKSDLERFEIYESVEENDEPEEREFFTHVLSDQL